MSDPIDDVTANWEQDGALLVKELDRVVLSKGAWATVVFKLQELDRKSGQYGGAKVSLRRYKKISGEYRQQSKFNISSLQQAGQLREVLSRWVDEGEPESEAEPA
jgi:hypothetical protein